MQPILDTIRFEAIGTKRVIFLPTHQQPAILVFVERSTSDHAPELTGAVRAIVPEVARLLVASVIFLKDYPPFTRPLATKIMTDAYFKSAEANRSRYERVEDHIILLPDWRGQVYAAAGIKSVATEPAIGLLHPNGEWGFIKQGLDLAHQIPELLRQSGLSD